MDEIIAYVAQIAPYCVEIDTTHTKTTPSASNARITHSDAILAWLHKLAHKPSLGFVAKELSEQRAAKCLVCPHHMPILGAGKQADEIERRSYLLRQGYSYTGLASCKMHDFDCQCAVRLKAEALEKQGGEPGCWLA
jgi:hypothetical protein